MPIGSPISVPDEEGENWQALAAGVADQNDARVRPQSGQAKLSQFLLSGLSVLRIRQQIKRYVGKYGIGDTAHDAT